MVALPSGLLSKPMRSWPGTIHSFRMPPDELNGFIATMIIPGPPFPEALHNKQFCGILWCYVGDEKKAEELFKPIMDIKPVFAHVGTMPYPAIQSMFDGLLPPGLQWYWRADFFNDLGADASAKHLEFGSKIPTPLSQMHMYPISGAASRVAKDATPWAYRDAKYAGVIVPCLRKYSTLYEIINALLV